jgi:hypothetical protein
MQKRSLLLPVLVLLFAGYSCKNKQEAPVDFFPVHSYLHSQVAHIDTSLYALRKVVRHNGVSDTSYLPREQFRKEAVDFLSIPDIASRKLKDDYTETKIYDDALKRVLFSYAPKEQDAPILRQDVTIEPGAGTDDAVKTIFINQLNDNSDSSVQKMMLWEVGKRFQVITTVSKKGSKDDTRTLEVWWAPLPSAK